MELPVILLLLACATDEVGAMEDAYGHPRAELANCVMTREDGHQTVYDDQGYPRRLGYPDVEVFTELETALDGLGRPTRITRWTRQADGERLGEWSWEADYVEDTWRLQQVRERGREALQNDLVLDYTWYRGGYEVLDERDLFYEEDRRCPRYVQLASGLRPQLSQSFCDGRLWGETAYTWARDRLVFRGAPDSEGLEERFGYDAQGRLSEISSRIWDGEAWVDLEERVEWDCE